MRVLVTGGSGFVGRHLLAALRARGDEVVSADRATAGGADHVSLDLRDWESVRSAVDRARPEVVFHLGAQSYVPDAAAAPLDTYDVNVMGTARLFEALRAAVPRARVVLVSSSMAAAPVNVYGASKAAAEAIARSALATSNLRIVIARGYNQIGPGQNPRFVVPSFASQLAAIAEGAAPVLHVGNLENQRDFLDVRDAVAAYMLLAERGVPGEVYDVCSGHTIPVSELLQVLIRIAGIEVELRPDPSRMRASENPMIFGDPARLREATKWEPQYALDDSLRDVYAEARRRMATAGRAG